VDDVVSIIKLFLYIATILALSMAITWLVVRISPSESAKEQKAKEAAGSDL
jgi:flagellar biogenesis protein FliO